MVKEESTGFFLLFRSHSALGRWKRDIPKLRTMKPFTALLFIRLRRYRWLRAVSEGLVSNQYVDGNWSSD